VEPKKQRLFIGYRSYGLFSKNDLTSYQPLEPLDEHLTKLKPKKLQKQKENLTPKIIKSSSVKKTCPHCSSFPLPLKVKCFRCKKFFLIKFVIPRQAYSQKND
jgi:hypothetical protein